MIPAVKRTAAVLVVGLLIAGCGGQGASSSASPLAKPSSSPATSLPASSPGASPAPLTGAGDAPGEDAGSEVAGGRGSEEDNAEIQCRRQIVCRRLLFKKKTKKRMCTRR